MAKQKIDNVYVAEGLAEDCEELILKCSQVSKLSFEKFSDIWREMEFASIFHGRPSGAELAEFCEEALHIAKFFLVSNIHNNLEKSVAGLFLVYSILNLQPYPRLAALRLVQDDVTAIEKLEYIARRERRHDILYILGEVLIRGPCQFHVSARERGLDYCIRKYYDGYTQYSIIGKRPTGVFHRHNEELDIIRELSYLEDRYEKAKKKIAGPEPDRSLNYANSRLAKDLQTSLKRVVSGIVVQDANNKTDEIKTQDHCDTVKAIKQRAMAIKVDPIKHLTGVEDRKQKRETPAKKAKSKKIKEYMNLLNTTRKKTSESDSSVSPIKSPKPYPWSLRLFNEFEEPTTSKHKPYENIVRTSPRIKKTPNSESPTKPDRGMMLIELEPTESPNKNDNNALDLPNTAKTPTKRSPRKNATPKRVRIDRLSEESPDEVPPAKKIMAKHTPKKVDLTENTFSSVHNTESQVVELTIDDIPIEFSAANNNVQIEIIDLYKGKGEKKTITLENGKQHEIKTKAQSVKLKTYGKKSLVTNNKASSSQTTQKTSEAKSNEQILGKEVTANQSSPILKIKQSTIMINEPSTSETNQKGKKISRKQIKLSKIRSRTKRLGIDQTVDFESDSESSD